MKVYELDELFGVSKAEIKAALKELGAKTHHLSAVEDETLAQLEERFSKTLEVDEVEGETLPDFSNEEREAPEVMPAEDVFPCVNDDGTFKGNCLLPPDLAEKVRPILKGKHINSYLLDLDRGEFVFIVWEEARKYRVRL